MTMKVTEKSIENKILEYLELRGCFPVKIERQGTFDRKSGAYRSTKNKYKRNGISDVMFFWKDKVYYAELKTPEKYGYIQRHFARLQAGEVKSQRSLTAQIDFLWQVRNKGQIGFFCDGVYRLRQIMEQAENTIPIIQPISK